MTQTDTLSHASAAAAGANDQIKASTRQLLVRLIVVALLIPLSFEVAGFRLTPSLLVMICLFPVLISRYLKKTVQWRLPDLLFFCYVGWQGLTIFLNNPERFVAYTGQSALLILAGFLAGRLLVLNKDDFYALIRFVAFAAMLTMPFALYESLMDDPIILRFIADYTPFETFKQNVYEPRLGLYRAQVVFTHPIHYGLMSALIITLFFVGLKDQIANGTRVIGAAVIGAACFFSVSSGAVLSIMLQLVLLLWYKVSALSNPRPWRAMLISGSILYVILELVSTKSAFVAISSRLAFNSGTTYYRTLIWEYGSQQVARTPIFGNGFNHWERPFWMLSSSVDNHWLLMAMVHGLPALIFFAGSILYAFVMVNRNTGEHTDPAMERLRLAWTLSLVGFCMSASTVAIWGEIQLLFMLLFGAGFWMIDHTSQPTDAGTPKPAAPTRAKRYTRFANGAGGVATAFRETALPASGRRSASAIQAARRAADLPVARSGNEARFSRKPS